jgi:hypothetical protein
MEISYRTGKLDVKYDCDIIQEIDTYLNKRTTPGYIFIKDFISNYTLPQLFRNIQNLKIGFEIARSNLLTDEKRKKQADDKIKLDRFIEDQREEASAARRERAMNEEIKRNTRRGVIESKVRQEDYIRLAAERAERERAERERAERERGDRGIEFE